MGARYGQALGRFPKWLHSDAMRRAGGDLTFVTLKTDNSDARLRMPNVHLIGQQMLSLAKFGG